MMRMDGVSWVACSTLLLSLAGLLSLNGGWCVAQEIDDGESVDWVEVHAKGKVGGWALDEPGAKLWLSDAEQGRLYAYDLVSGERIKGYRLGGEPGRLIVRDRWLLLELRDDERPAASRSRPGARKTCVSSPISDGAPAPVRSRVVGER